MTDHATPANREATRTPSDGPIDQATEAILAIAAVIEAHQKLTTRYNTADPLSAQLFKYASAGKALDSLDAFMRLWAQRGLLLSEDGRI